MDVLVTGGAGFIGSHLVDALVAEGRRVRVLDDLDTGKRENVNAAADLHVGSVADPDAVAGALDGVEVVYHLGAHGAVARSLADPLATDTANVRGTLCMLKGAVDAGVKRFVFASSSSVYGGAEQVPTPESAPLVPRSPYAVSKLAGEHYTRVFAELTHLETVSLRFFNVYGPRQRPDSAYAAVIPLFARAALAGERPTVHGDGRQNRDFTFVLDVVAALIAAGSATAEACSGKAYNVAAGESHDLLEILDVLGRLTGTTPSPVFAEPRLGDVRRSLASVEAAARCLGFRAAFQLEDGLSATVDWLRQQG